MDLSELVRKAWNDAQPEYWKFVAESDAKLCKVCGRYDGMVFRGDSPEKPELPLHPNCRCHFERVSAPRS